MTSFISNKSLFSKVCVRIISITIFYCCRDLNLENSDEENLEEDPSILDSPVGGSRKAARLISESTDDEYEGDNVQGNGKWDSDGLTPGTNVC